MFRKLKYIRTEGGFILFSEPMMHSEVRPTAKIISAGFYSTSGGVQCFGESISLNLKSLPEDSELLAIQLKGEWR